MDSDVATKRATYQQDHWSEKCTVSSRRRHILQGLLLASIEQPRAVWKLGVIKKLLIGADGENRAAVLRHG